MFGFLKFFSPFKGWYAIQIAASELGELSYMMGIMGELGVGMGFIFALLFKNKLSDARFTSIIVGASLIVVIMMAIGTYVHLHPSVPAEVSPLGIKPPYIPTFFLLPGLTNAVAVYIIIILMKKKVLQLQHKKLQILHIAFILSGK